MRYGKKMAAWQFKCQKFNTTNKKHCYDQMIIQKLFANTTIKTYNSLTTYKCLFKKYTSVYLFD